MCMACACIHVKACPRLHASMYLWLWREKCVCESLSKHSAARREVEQSSRYAPVLHCHAVFPLCIPSYQSEPVPQASLSSVLHLRYDSKVRGTLSSLGSEMRLTNQGHYSSTVQFTPKLRVCHKLENIIKTHVEHRGLHWTKWHSRNWPVYCELKKKKNFTWL